MHPLHTSPRGNPVRVRATLNRSQHSSCVLPSVQLRCNKLLSFNDKSSWRNTKVIRSISVESDRSSEPEQETSKFNWFKNWWPVQATGNLKTDRSNKITLLGKEFIVWKGHSGNWIAMDDECPHRLAPLSEGRIEKDGNLLCSYHAWRFNESGKCVKIPHAEDEKAHSIACNSPMSAVQTYPCKSHGALLWIWPDDSVSAFSDSETSPVFIDDDLGEFLDRASAQGLFYPYVRYVPFSYDVLMENLIDPCHFSVSHHGLRPSISRYNSKPIYGRVSERTGPRPVIGTMDYTSFSSFYGNSHFELEPPGAVFLYSKGGHSEAKAYPNVIFIAVPVSSMRSIQIIIEASDKTAFEENRISFFQKLKKRMMIWVRHVVVLDKVIDGDAVLLHGQDKRLRAAGTQFVHSRDYFKPTSADLLVSVFRNWFENEGNYGIDFGGHKTLHKEMVDVPKEQLLDRYELHIKHCKVCNQALLTIQRIVKFFKFLSVVSILMASRYLLRDSNGLSLSLSSLFSNVTFLVSCFVFGISVVAVVLLEKKVLVHFRFMDHVHADND